MWRRRLRGRLAVEDKKMDARLSEAENTLTADKELIPKQSRVVQRNTEKSKATLPERSLLLIKSDYEVVVQELAKNIGLDSFFDDMNSVTARKRSHVKRVICSQSSPETSHLHPINQAFSDKSSRTSPPWSRGGDDHIKNIHSPFSTDSAEDQSSYKKSHQDASQTQPDTRSRVNMDRNNDDELTGASHVDRPRDRPRGCVGETQ